MIDTKRCNKCGEIKPLTEFYVHINHGITPQCKDCARKYHKEHITRIKENKKKYYIDHADHIKTKSKEYRTENKEKLQTYFKKHYEENNLKIKEYWKKQNIVNVDKRKAWNKNWRDNNIEKVKNAASKRRALMKGVVSENINLLEFYNSSNWVCGVCGKKIDKKLEHPNPKSVSLDHIIPISKGGSHTHSNVQPAHLYCNMSKQNKINNIQLRLA